jgi:LPXTG-motif cell wall-anchored protein
MTEEVLVRRACVILALAACLILAMPLGRSAASPTQNMQPAIAANVAVAASSAPHHRDTSAMAPASLPNTGAALNASPWSLVGVLALLMLGLGFMLHRMARQI